MHVGTQIQHPKLKPFRCITGKIIWKQNKMPAFRPNSYGMTQQQAHRFSKEAINYASVHLFSPVSVAEDRTVRTIAAGASQGIMGKSSVRDDYQLKALKVVMISKEFLMRICEGGSASLEVKCSMLKATNACRHTYHTIKVISCCNQLSSHYFRKK